MICKKCKGMMAHEKFYDCEGEYFWGFRCINCGTIVDDVIRKNRGIIDLIEDLLDIEFEKQERYKI